MVKLGFTVCSTWIDVEWELTGTIRPTTPLELRQKFAQDDLADVRRCNVMVNFTEPPNSCGRGGRHVEFGLAAAWGKRLIVVGYRENVFHHLPQVEFAENFNQVVTMLSAGPSVGDVQNEKSMTIAELIREAHATAVEKGWWERDRPFSEGIALMHSELSEALEDWRKWGMDPSKFIIGPNRGEPCGEDAVVAGLAVELADVLIRIGDWCGKHGIPLEDALRAKMAYNKTRPHRHGGKLA